MRRLLRDLASQGRTVLVSSHVLTEMQQLVDHAVIIDAGRLRFQGPLADLTGTPSTVVEVRPGQTELLRAALAPYDDVRVDADGNERLLVTGLPAAVVGHAAFAAGVELQWLSERDRDLERLFFTLTSGADSPDRVSNASEVGA